MFRNVHWSIFLKNGLIAAIFYCAAVFLFIKDARFQETWVLYVGNFLFVIVVVCFLVWFNRRRKENKTSVSMFMAGHLLTAVGIVYSFIISFILLIILIPGFLHTGQTEKILRGLPANSIHDRTNGLAFIVFANALVGNFFTGAFVSLVFPFSMKEDPTTDKISSRQAELKP
jgi:hypothetical protein